MYGIGNFLTRSAHQYPNRTAIADISGAMTYLELNANVNRLANNLLRLGLSKGDRLGFLCNNCNQFVELWLATQKVGIVAVLLNYKLTESELGVDLRRALCKGLLYAPSLTERVLACRTPDSQLKLLITFGQKCLPSGCVDIDMLCAEGDDNEPPSDISETDWSTILFTSGSTGMSKGVVRTHRIILEYAMQMAAESEVYKTRHISVISHSPLFHTGGLSMLMKMIALGGTYVGVNGVSPGLIASLIDKYKLTQVFFVPPANIMRFRGHPEIKEYDLSTVDLIWATGGKLSVEYAAQMLRIFPNATIKTSYGGTEFCASCSICFDLTKDTVAENEHILTSAGYIGAFADMKLVNEKGDEVPAGELGEALVRSPFVMSCYLDEPEATAEALADGWYHTGDMFRRDENGLYFFADRKRFMIKTGGENVYPLEIESVLRGFPGIVDCAVVGIPDPKWEEAVAAVLITDGTLPSFSALHNYCKCHMANFKKPLYYAILPELPLTASGKPDKRALVTDLKGSFTHIDDLISQETNNKENSND